MPPDTIFKTRLSSLQPKPETKICITEADILTLSNETMQHFHPFSYKTGILQHSTYSLQLYSNNTYPTNVKQAPGILY